MNDKEKELIVELYNSIRLLLRHCMSNKDGGGVSPVVLMEQMQKLDKAFGKHWTPSTSTGSGYSRRKSLW